MQNTTTPRSWRFHAVRCGLLALLVLAPLLGTSCTGEVLPFLQHFKRPIAMTMATRSTDNINYMYVANADIDRLAMVHVPQRSLLIDPSPSTPGIMLIPTGRYPVDIATSPDQKRIFVLHGIEGNIGIIDVDKNAQETDDKGAPKRVPTGCTNNRCWKSPSRLLLHTVNDKLYGIVAIPAESSVAVVDLTDGDDFGKEIKRLRVSGLPHSLILDAKNNLVYVTNSRSQTVTVSATQERKLTFVHAIDLAALTIQNIQICESLEDNGELLSPPCGPNGEGTVSADGRWLYLIDQVTGGIRIYDTKEKKTVDQGDQRFPGLSTIQAPNNAAFLSVQFLTPISLTTKNADGNDVLLTKAFAWASASDGYGYVIDPEKHAVVDTTQAGPSVQDLAMFIGEDTVGDPRDPIRPGLPTLRTDSSIDGDTGVAVFDGKTRSEQWALVYEGLILDSRTGRFSDLTKGEFADAASRDLTLDGVQKGDILVLLDCIPGTDTPADGGTDGSTDGGTADTASTGTPCELNITEVERHRLVVDVTDKNIPTRSSWQFQIRAQAGSFLATGSFEGKLPGRVIPGTLFTSEYFSLTLNKATEPTPRDTRIEFSTLSGNTTARILLGGLSNRITSAASHVGCSSNCELETCKEHPSCTKTKCVTDSPDSKLQCSTDEDCIDGTCTPQQRVWFLDPSSSRLYVVNPSTLLAENTIR